MVKKWRLRARFLVSLFTGVLTSCSDPTLFTQVASDQSGLAFTNRVVESDTINLAYNYYFYNGGGVTVADFNNDGWEDVLLTGNHVPSRLYLNQGGLVFTDVSEAAGVLNDYWASGSTLVDINGDHLQDIFICTVGKHEPNMLYVNQGVGIDGVPVFQEQAAAYGLDDVVISTQAAFLDYDRDNDLDLFVAVNSQLTNNRNETKVRNQPNSETRDRFYRNNGDNTFTDVSEDMGVTNEGYSLGLAVNDLNDDGWPDIYVANDFISNDLVYINNQRGAFEEKGAAYLRHTSQNGMGVDIADVNQDGRMDITVVDMLPRSNRRRKLMMSPLNYDLYEYRQKLGYLPQHVKNTLQLNQGPDETGMYHFSEVGTLAGMHSTDWSWAPLWADVDNSGTLDLFITNGYYKDLTDLDFSRGLKENLKFGSKDYSHSYQLDMMTKLRTIKAANFLYQNEGALALNEISETAGLAEPSFSHGAAFADLDHDGDLDLVVNNLGHEAFLYRNNAREEEPLSHRNYLSVRPEGPGKNTNAVGTRLTLFYQGTRQTYYHSPVRGYLSSTNTIHFGLGDASRIDSLRVHWPDGAYQTATDVAINQVLTVAYHPSHQTEVPLSNPDPLFVSMTDSLRLRYQHQENHFTDFKDNPLLLKMHSRPGPALSVADINDDGQDDILIGGAAGQPASLFVQQSGHFTCQPFLEEDAAYEDVGTLWFDADGDHDADLYVVSGGVEQPDSSGYEDRLYLNDGQRFVRSAGLPALASSGGPVRGADVDRDGDIDLFVGGHGVPGRYPTPAESRLLINEHGTFTDRTPAALRTPGMISDALWTDFNNDDWPDLILVGEWTPILFFVNRQGTLAPYTEQTGLENTSGWWNSLTAGDYDYDGDMDYLVGNFGLNSYITASPSRPVRLYADDFNEDHDLDPILSYYAEDDEGELHEFPVHPRDALIDQIVGYKKRFPDYQSFAQARFSEVLKPQDRKQTTVLSTTTLSSSYVENRGDGTFSIRPLPRACQVAPVYGMLTQDVDGDGNLDVITTGNQYAAEPVFGNYDASNGVWLKGDGTGQFTPVPTARSGLFLGGDQRSLVTALVDNQPLLVAGANSGPLKAYRFHNTLPVSDAITVAPDEAYVEITFRDGRRTIREYYYGSTYLSQSSRKLVLHDDMEEVVIVSSTGQRRRVR